MWTNNVRINNFSFSFHLGVHINFSITFYRSMMSKSKSGIIFKAWYISNVWSRIPNNIYSLFKKLSEWVKWCRSYKLRILKIYIYCLISYFKYLQMKLQLLLLLYYRSKRNLLNITDKYKQNSAKLNSFLLVSR